MLAVIDTVVLIISALIWLMIAQFVLSLLLMFNVVTLHNPTVGGLWHGLERLLEPVYRPVRKLVPPMGGMDLSPMVVIILLQVISRALQRFAYSGMV